VSVQAVIIELLRRLQRERQLAMIFITHNLALVRNIAQSAIVLSQGNVVEYGPVEQILEHPTDPYTIRLIQDVPKLAAAGAAPQIRSAVQIWPDSAPGGSPGQAGPGAGSHAAPASWPANP
jgi:peptide/nickel transport system ATP-binding protein